jgi:hypothetical protein
LSEPPRGQREVREKEKTNCCNTKGQGALDDEELL